MFTVCHRVVSIHIHYASMTRLICAPPSHTSVTDFTVSIFLYVIVWFRSTSSDILLVGTHPLRFNDFYIIGWFRSTSSTVVGTHPLRFNDSMPPPTHILIYQLSLSCLLIYYNLCLPY